jgi:hypothetical protein
MTDLFQLVMYMQLLSRYKVRSFRSCDCICCCCSSRWGETVSELRPTASLLLIPHTTYKYGEPRWNDIDRESRRSWKKPVPVPICPPQIPYGLTRSRTRASAGRSRWLNVSKNGITSITRMFCIWNLLQPPPNNDRTKAISPTQTMRLAAHEA